MSKSFKRKFFGVFFRIVPWIIIIGAGILWHQGHIRPLADFLSQPEFTIKVGKTKITPYLILKTLFILIMFIWFALRLSDLAAASINKLKNISSSNRALAIKTLNILIYVVVFLIGIDVMGLDITALTVFSGAIGIGVGFGLQKVASNFISGLILLFEKSVKEGDLIDLGNGISGFIRYTGARYTLLETYDGKEIMIPNEDFISSKVTNLTYTNKMGRMELHIGVSYDSDLLKAKEIILNAAQNHKFCSKEKKPECFIENFSDFSISILLHMWLDDVTDGRFSARNDILLEVWQKFKENNIVIPYPQREVRIVKD